MRVGSWTGDTDTAAPETGGLGPHVRTNQRRGWGGGEEPCSTLSDLVFSLMLFAVNNDDDNNNVQCGTMWLKREEVGVQNAYDKLDFVAECFLLVSPMASGNMKIGLITECIQQLTIKTIKCPPLWFCVLIESINTQYSDAGLVQVWLLNGILITEGQDGSCVHWATLISWAAA